MTFEQLAILALPLVGLLVIVGFGMSHDGEEDDE